MEERKEEFVQLFKEGRLDEVLPVTGTPPLLAATTTIDDHEMADKAQLEMPSSGQREKDGQNEEESDPVATHDTIDNKPSDARDAKDQKENKKPVSDDKENTKTNANKEPHRKKTLLTGYPNSEFAHLMGTDTFKHRKTLLTGTISKLAHPSESVDNKGQRPSRNERPRKVLSVSAFGGGRAANNKNTTEEKPQQQPAAVL
mmetsp:Transcript_8101/g.14303  ORF Transcript_8101/g.14303 Transcript_8101/m.14303 type:complete len:201 (-) Transcript_8101:108-710(-)